MHIVVSSTGYLLKKNKYSISWPASIVIWMMLRGRVGAKDPFLLPEDVFVKIRREEMRRKVMLTDEVLVSTPEVSAFATNKVQSQDQRTGKRPWCEHCNRPGHTMDKC